MSKYTVCVDFDGVLTDYSGWKGEDHFDSPREGAKEFLEELANEYKVVILTTRPSDKVWAWLREHGLDKWVTDVTDRKPPALVYVDDRAVCFRGNFRHTLYDIRAFEPYWRKKKKENMIKRLNNSMLGLSISINEILDYLREENQDENI